MAVKGLILVIEEKSGRILAAKVISANRVEYEFERLTDHFDFGVPGWDVLSPISQTFVIRLKPISPSPTIQVDQNVTILISSSPRPLP